MSEMVNDNNKSSNPLTDGNNEVFNNKKLTDNMESRANKSRKRHSGIQSPMLKKVLKTMPSCKENIPELPYYNSIFTNGLKKCLGITTNEMENETTIEEKVKVVRFKQPTQKYTKEALLELQNLSSSKVRPKFLDNFPDLDLELAGKTRKGSRPVASGKPATSSKTVAFDLPPWQNQPTENGELKTEKKPQDAKDRLKKDQDIVLSPQRRSFNSGCFVTMNASSGPKRSNSPLNTSAKQYVEREPIREPRRVGSGRLMSRDSWDSGFRQPENGIGNNYNFGKGGFRESSSHNSIEPRRKDFEFDRGETDRYRNYDRFKGSSNYDRRRNDSYRTQEEPEWMTDGPTSQHDTIELRGFEDPPVDKTKKKKTKPAARTKKNSMDSTSTESAAAIKGVNETKTKKTKKEKDEDKKKKSTVDKPNNESEDQTKKDSDSITGNEFIQAYDAEHKTNDNVFNDFNIDDFLKPDYLSDIMHIEGETDGNVAGSRFRQWFTTHDSSRASSASTEMLNSATNKVAATDNTEEDPRQLSSMLMGMVKHNSQNESKNLTNAYDSITLSENNKLPPAIMDVIKASAPQLTDPKAAIRDLEVNGKVQSLEEIESRLRMSSGQQNGYSPPLSNIQFHEELKLKKLQNMKMPQNELENSNNDGHVTNNSQNYSILQMLNNAQGPQNYMVNQGQNPAGQYGSSNNYRSQQPNMQVPNDLVMKLMEAQQIQKQHENMVAKAMAAQQQQSKQHMFKLPVELQNMVNFYTPTKDILQSREAQEMLMGIKRGEVMLHHLVEQWKKTSANQSRYRETLICLMKVFQHSSNAQRMANQQDIVYQQQQQAALYQSQMLKRQLLDQNHKRMENVHNASYGESGMDLGSTQSQSQPRIGLTPTSVLRKMTSTSEPLIDKHHIPDERSVTQHALQHQINTLQQQIQQQQFMQHQQQQQQQQQRPVNTTIQQILSGNYPRYHGTQQQQQPQSNNMNGRSLNYGSGDKSRMNRVQSPVSNQLARWFSPELLAQARAGRLPNMPAMSQNINMLSVEDIEKFQVGGRS